MHQRFVMWTLLALSCAGGQPSTATVQWVTQLRPLLADNGLLAERVLRAAADVANDTAAPEATRQEWESTIAPLARHLHEQASLVQADGPWIEPHERLTRLWGSRATGYDLVVEALRTGDDERWRRGRALADQAKLDEEAWFKEVGGRLAVEGVRLDQFP